MTGSRTVLHISGPSPDNGFEGDVGSWPNAVIPALIGDLVRVRDSHFRSSPPWPFGEATRDAENAGPTSTPAGGWNGYFRASPACPFRAPMTMKVGGSAGVPPEASQGSARRSRDLAPSPHPLGALPNPAWHRVDAGEGGLRASVYWPPGRGSRGPASVFNQATPPFGVLRSGAVPRQRPPGATPGSPQRLICSGNLVRDELLEHRRAVQFLSGSLCL